MTVKELMKELSQLDPNLEVAICWYDTEHSVWEYKYLDDVYQSSNDEKEAICVIE